MGLPGFISRATGLFAGRNRPCNPCAWRTSRPTGSFFTLHPKGRPRAATKARHRDCFRSARAVMAKQDNLRSLKENDQIQEQGVVLHVVKIDRKSTRLNSSH